MRLCWCAYLVNRACKCLHSTSASFPIPPTNTNKQKTFSLPCPPARHPLKDLLNDSVRNANPWDSGGVKSGACETHQRSHIAATATTSDEAGDLYCCDCAVAAEVEYGDEDEMRADAAVVLQTELEQELEVDTRADGKVSLSYKQYALCTFLENTHICTSGMYQNRVHKMCIKCA